MNGTVNLSKSELPLQLRAIPSPPQNLWVRGGSLTELAAQPCLSVVGSRSITPYGKAVMQTLLPEVVRGGAVIVSGLALGVDAQAHQIALDNGGFTIAVLPSSVHEVYPATNRQLAQRILDNGGCLISEYPDGTDARREHFIARNRLVSGLSKAVLIIEAAEKSGTLHTANFALEQGRDVLVVPGNITSPQSAGTNSLLKAGATPVTSSADILQVLDLGSVQPQQQIFASTPEEAAILTLLATGPKTGQQLLLESKLPATVFHQTMTLLELNGTIKALGADNWAKSG